MTDVILEPERCSTCGQFVPSPADGRWRFAKSGTVFETMDDALQAAEALNIKNDRFEFTAATDAEGRYRIASRRLPDQP